MSASSSSCNPCLCCRNSTHTHGLGHVFGNGVRLCIACAHQYFLKGMDAAMEERLHRLVANDNHET